MLVLALLATLGLASAQVLGPYYSGLYSQALNNCPKVKQSRSCLAVDAIPVSLTKLYYGQPIFTIVVSGSGDNKIIDNVCTTVFPTPNDPNNFIIYDSYVYFDGSNKIVTSLGTQISSGTFQKSSATVSLIQRYFAFKGDNTYISCQTSIYGGGLGSSVFVISLGTREPVSPLSLNNIQNIVSSNGQDSCNLIVLPYNRPTRCVLQQVCSIVNPFQH